LSTGGSDSQQVIQEALAEEWNSTHDDIKITFEYTDNLTASDVLLTQVAAGTPPDLVGPVGIAGLYTYPDLWMDLAPYIERDQAELNLDEYDANVLKLYEQIGGQNLSIALGVYPSFMWVNEDLFAAAEVPLPPQEIGAPYVNRDGETVAWDWDTVAVVAQQVTQDANGLYGDEEGFDAAQTIVWGYADWWNGFRSMGVRFGSPNSGIDAEGMADFDNEAYVKVADWYHRGVFEWQFIPDQAEGDAVTAGTSPFESGKLGMWYSHTWYTCCMAGANFKWGTYAPPAVPGTDGATVVAPLHADTYAIPNGVANPDASWEVLKWLNSAETASQLCEAFGCMPARTTARTSWQAQMAESVPNFNIPLIEAAAGAADVPNHESYIPGGAQIYGLLDSFRDSLRVDPELDVTTALPDLNAAVQAVIEEAGQ
jgi:multiple sugar transport system substrate-binding protein